MIWFAIASLTPAVFLALACLWGGPWPVLSVLSITGLVYAMDKLPRVPPVVATSGRGLSLTLAGVHFALLPLGIWALSENPELGLVDKVLVFTGLGMFAGQVSNANAHELIHAAARPVRRVGAAVYASVLYGHHVSAHLRVHHIYAATAADPNSARKGEGFWAFALRALRGEFIAGLKAETAHRARASTSKGFLSHPYLGYLAMSLLWVILAATIGGTKGVAFYLGIVIYAQFQLLLSDYVQHYGLRRRPLRGGKPEPMGPQHSWNAPQWYSSAMMLNAPRHSDHHQHPSRAFPELEVLPDKMPVLPYSLPVMALLALSPRLWRRVMDPRVARWQNMA